MGASRDGSLLAACNSPSVSRWRAAATAAARGGALATITLVAWCAAMLAMRRAPAITDDWQGWRQADTQAIARNLAFEEFAPWKPRIDWRGDGPGYVETEAQLYPTLIAIGMTATGETVWVGQILSLLCVAGAVFLAWRALAKRFGDHAGYGAMLAMLGHHGTIAMSTSIQPDALALLAFVVGFIAFLDGRWTLWVVATAIAGLVKPTTLELGIAQFVIVVATHRLRDVKIWIGWAIVIAVVAGFMAYARTLFVDYGNTFGVLSGGDSKLPAASKLLAPATWTELARYAIVWGTGVLAIPAAIYLAWKRKLRAEHAALAIAAVILVVVALRYTSGVFGTHYHLPHVLLGGWLVAAALHELRGAVVALVAVGSLVMGVRAVQFLDRPVEKETVLGIELAKHAAPGTLVAVRARAESYNTEWHTVNNYEDPRVFYVSRTKGWVLPNDLAGAQRLASLPAKFYVHVAQMPVDAELAAWLAAHATRVYAGAAGEIYALVK